MDSQEKHGTKMARNWYVRKEMKLFWELGMLEVRMERAL